MILQIIGTIFWALILPLACGLWITSKLDKQYQTPGMALLSGYLVNISLFQCLYIVVLLWNSNFKLLVVIFAIVDVLVAVLSVVFGHKAIKEWKPKKISLWWILPIGLIVFQMVMRILTRVYDGDDAFYVATALLTKSTGRIGEADPYTGLATTLDTRHAFAAAPAFIAYLSKVTGVHATIMAHIIWADLVLLLVYITFTVIGKTLLRDKKEYVPFFVTLVAILNIFGFSSIYMPATFLLTRTWQGKAMYAAWILPAIFMVLLILAQSDAKKKEQTIGTWFLAAVIMIAGTAMTTAGTAMSPCLFGLGVLLLAICKKQWKWFLYAGLCCIVNVVIGVIFVLS